MENHVLEPLDVETALEAAYSGIKYSKVLNEAWKHVVLTLANEVICYRELETKRLRGIIDPG